MGFLELLVAALNKTPGRWGLKLAPPSLSLAWEGAVRTRLYLGDNIRGMVIQQLPKSGLGLEHPHEIL